MPEEQIQPQAENQNVGDDANVVTSPVTEPQAAENSEQPDLADRPSDQDESQETDRKPSRAERRIRGQNAQIKALESQLRQTTEAPANAYQGLPWQNQQQQLVDAFNRGEITAEQLLATTREVAAQEAATSSTKTERRIRYELDLRDVEAKHPELNPESDEYDPEYAQLLAATYQQMGGIEGGARLTEVVGRIDALANKKTARAQQQTVQTLAKQAANGALTPSTGPERSVDPSQSAKQRWEQTGKDEDLVDYLGQTMFKNRPA